MPPLSVDPCEACFPPTVDTTEELSFVPHEHPTARVLPATVAHRQQTVHCEFAVGLAYDVRCGQGGVRGEVEAMEGVGEYGRGAVGRSRTALRDHRYHRDAASEFKCCAVPTAPGLRSDETVSSVYEDDRNRVHAAWLSDRCLRSVPLRHSPHPCLGVDLLRTIRR